MLLGDLYSYKIKEHCDGKIDAVIELNKKHLIFKGHFPEYPLVPGVSQVLMVKEILNRCLNLNLQLISSKSIKFLAMITPNEIETLQLSISYKKEADNSYKVNALLYGNETNFLKLKGNYSER